MGLMGLLEKKMVARMESALDIHMATDASGLGGTCVRRKCIGLKHSGKIRI